MILEKYNKKQLGSLIIFSFEVQQIFTEKSRILCPAIIHHSLNQFAFEKLNSILKGRTIGFPHVQSLTMHSTDGK